MAANDEWMPEAKHIRGDRFAATPRRLASRNYPRARRFFILQFRRLSRIRSDVILQRIARAHNWPTTNATATAAARAEPEILPAEERWEPYYAKNAPKSVQQAAASLGKQLAMCQLVLESCINLMAEAQDPRYWDARLEAIRLAVPLTHAGAALGRAIAQMTEEVRQRITIERAPEAGGTNLSALSPEGSARACEKHSRNPRSGDGEGQKFENKSWWWKFRRIQVRPLRAKTKSLCAEARPLRPRAARVKKARPPAPSCRQCSGCCIEDERTDGANIHRKKMAP